MALVSAVALLAAAGAASAASGSVTRASSTCWKDVINDWLVHEPNVVGTYPLVCYTQALQNLSQYQDIQGYSNAPQDIRRAYLAALRDHKKGSGPSSSSSGPGTGPTTKPPSGNGPGGGSQPQSSGSKSPLTRLFNAVGPGNAQSVPLPLLVLGGLAVLLMLAALGTWLARRVQTRRMTPSPAPARRR